MREYENYLNVHDGIANKFDQAVFLKKARSYDRIYSRFLPESREACILDIGCGTGLFLCYLRQCGYKNYYGIDVSKENIGFVRQNITDKCEHVNVLEYLQSKEESFDVVVMNEVLEHISKENTIKLLELVHKALKANGLFLVLVPNMENPVTVYTRWHDFTHSTAFTRNSLKMVLRLGGFTDITIYPTIVFTKHSFIKRSIGGILRYITRKFLERLFEYPRNGILFSKRIFAVTRK